MLGIKEIKDFCIFNKHCTAELSNYRNYKVLVIPCAVITTNLICHTSEDGFQIKKACTLCKQKVQIMKKSSFNIKQRRYKANKDKKSQLPVQIFAAKQREVSTH